MNAATRLTGDEAWALFQAKAKAMDLLTWRTFRREVEARIDEENPDLEELGSSDLNCYAVTYIERGDIVFTDTGWHWPFGAPTPRG